MRARSWPAVPPGCLHKGIPHTYALFIRCIRRTLPRPPPPNTHMATNQYWGRAAPACWRTLLTSPSPSCAQPCTTHTTSVRNPATSVQTLYSMCNKNMIATPATLQQPVATDRQAGARATCPTPPVPLPLPCFSTSARPACGPPHTHHRHHHRHLGINALSYGAYGGAAGPQARPRRCPADKLTAQHHRPPTTDLPAEMLDARSACRVRLAGRCAELHMRAAHARCRTCACPAHSPPPPRTQRTPAAAHVPYVRLTVKTARHAGPPPRLLAGTLAS